MSNSGRLEASTVQTVVGMAVSLLGLHVDVVRARRLGLPYGLTVRAIDAGLYQMAVAVLVAGALCAIFAVFPSQRGLAALSVAAAASTFAIAFAALSRAASCLTWPRLIVDAHRAPGYYLIVAGAALSGTAATTTLFTSADDL